MGSNCEARCAGWVTVWPCGQNHPRFYADDDRA
jgi:hypothetical protein